MQHHALTARTALRRALFASVLAGSGLFTISAIAQTTFDVATIRPSSGAVRFEHDGTTQFAYGTLRMHDVTADTCIQLAYGISQSLITGPSSMRDVHYDITAKADPNTTEQQMQLMLRALLHDRFNLAFHLEKKELRVYNLVVAGSDIKIKMHPSAPGGEMHHENSATGMVGHSMTMQELATYLSEPLGAPLTDHTGLPGRYDFTIDFTPYVETGPTNDRPDPAAVLKSALKGELGLELVQRKDQVDVMIVDHIDPPSSN